MAKRSVVVVGLSVVLLVLAPPLRAEPMLSATPDWSAQGDNPNADFGWSVGGQGDVNGDGYDDVVVGAQGFDGLGAVYVYLGGPTGLSTTPAWSTLGPGSNSSFGRKVAILGDVNGDGYDDVLVGAPGYPTEVYPRGTVFLYLGSSSGLGATPAWTVTAEDPLAFLGGGDLGGAGDVNSDGYNDLFVSFLISQNGTGKGYVYLGSSTGPEPIPGWTVGGDSSFRNLHVGAAGDVNGDGYDDMIVITRQYGPIGLYFGSPAGLTTTPAQTWFGSGEELGAGDVNGDGYGDVAIVTEGAVKVHLGSPSGLNTTAAWSYTPSQSLEVSVDLSGDVNGDGYDDVLVGEPRFDHEFTDEGQTLLFLGSPAGPGSVLRWSAEGDNPGGLGTGALFGIDVAFTGDVYGDGTEGVLVGARSYTDPEAREGAAFLFRGLHPGHAPVAHAGADRIECPSPEGTVVLDGSQSVDADSTPGTNDDIVSFDWFLASGQVSLGAGEVLETTLPVGASLVVLRATDHAGNADTDEVWVTVGDTVPPLLSLTITPAILWPPNHQLVNVTASVSATDSCSTPTIVLSAIVSSEPDDAPGGGDGNTTGDIAGASFGSPDFDFQLRAERSSQGLGRVYLVTYVATDAAGNSSEASVDLTVPQTVHGRQDPVSLRVEQTDNGTVLRWDPVEGAQRYNVIRGDLADLREFQQTIQLGPAACVEAGSADETTVGWEDPSLPAPGRAFFFFVEYYDDDRSSGYGSPDVTVPREAQGETCPTAPR